VYFVRHYPCATNYALRLIENFIYYYYYFLFFYFYYYYYYYHWQREFLYYYIGLHTLMSTRSRGFELGEEKAVWPFGPEAIKGLVQYSSISVRLEN
jgi:hypothetical protein